jgi:WD40 repeat protein
MSEGPGLSGGKLTATSLADIESIPIFRPNPDLVFYNSAKYALSSRTTDSFRSGHQQKIMGLSWNMEGKRLISASADHSLKLWELDQSGLRLKTSIPHAHSEAVQLVHWSKMNPDLFITTCWDGNVILWDARMDSKKRHVQKVATVAMKGENINLAWSLDGNSIAVGSKRDDISIIDARMMAEKGAVKTWSLRGIAEVRFFYIARDFNVFVRLMRSCLARIQIIYFLEHQMDK